MVELDGLDFFPGTANFFCISFVQNTHDMAAYARNGVVDFCPSRPHFKNSAVQGGFA